MDVFYYISEVIHISQVFIMNIEINIKKIILFNIYDTKSLQ